MSNVHLVYKLQPVCEVAYGSFMKFNMFLDPTGAGNFINQGEMRSMSRTAAVLAGKDFEKKFDRLTPPLRKTSTDITVSISSAPSASITRAEGILPESLSSRTQRKNTEFSGKTRVKTDI